MSRVRPAGFSISPDDLPVVKLDKALIRARLSTAGIDEARHPAIINVLQTAMDGYCLDRIADRRGATPAEIRAYFRTVRKAIEQMRTAIGKGAGDARISKAIIDQAYAKGHLPVGFADDLDLMLQRFASGVANANAEIIHAQTISGKTEQARRHRKLAKGFLMTFGANGLPTDLKPNGLMLQLFSECLRAVGEKQARPDRIFNEVSKRMSGQALH